MALVSTRHYRHRTCYSSRMANEQVAANIVSAHWTSPTQRRKEGLRRRIIEVATELYANNGGADGGFEKTTVEAIAAGADISVRTFFRYFTSKTDVIFLDCNRSIEALVQSIDGRLAAGEPPVTAVVAASLDQVHRFIADPVNRARLQRSLLAPEFKERLAVFREQQRVALTEAIGRGAGTDLKAAELARVTASIVRGTVATALDSWALDPTQVPEEAIVRILEALAPIVTKLAAVGKSWRRIADSSKKTGTSSKLIRSAGNR